MIELAESDFERFSNYAVVSDGRVFSRVKSSRYGTVGPWRQLSGWITTQGYRAYSLTRDDGAKVTVTGHRLVASIFIGAVPSGWDVCHENGDKLDNRAENLRIDTKGGNARDRSIHGTETRGEDTFGSKLKADQVLEIHSRLMAGEKRRDLALEFNVTYSAIRGIDEGRNWSWLTSTQSS